MSSIRGRLLVWLLSAVALAAAGGGWLSYRNARLDADAFFDQHLAQTALTLRDQAFEYAASPELREAQAEYDFVVQVFSLQGVRVYLSHPHATLPGLTTLGLSDVETGDGRWRVFGVQARGYVIQVAQPMRIREQRAAAFALRTLLPFLLAMPALAVVLWLAVGRALRPLEELGARVRAREPGDLAPLAEQGLPAEVQPLVASLNDLLQRLASVLQHERAFIADAAHELRTPLTALRLQAQALGHAADSERTATLGQLLAGVQRASRLVEQLLAMARQEPGAAPARGRVALDALAREAVAELVPLADARQVDLGLSDAAAVAVTGDEAALRVLVRNLVDNAVRYTPAGGRVDVAVVDDTHGVQLLVTDTGPGIPQAERERVFDRFYRPPGTEGVGSGLGLAIVRAVAQAHGAEVRLEEGPGASGLRAAVRFAERAAP
jgi:two-component system OmpR family sensor kinase